VLCADTAEADRRLRAIAVAADLEHHALSEGRVLDVVADLEPESLRVRRLRRLTGGAQSSLDDALAVLLRWRGELAGGG